MMNSNSLLDRVFTGRPSLNAGMKGRPFSWLSAWELKPDCGAVSLTIDFTAE